ncbi:MAG TPA: OmpA family protein [Candidatus Acidoferrales bacterium]|jgi:outer membrane protein OmpA-like peptidoglycan-associated protein|nr:OmpA family protein [Candidatus Acidoferrales bacterium]
MKKSYILSLCLAAALAVPAVAQQNQNQSNTQDQPQTQAQQPADQNAQSADQTQGATGKEPLKYERHEGFWGHMNPFARKKYVNRQLDPIRGRVNELDELTGKNAKMIADVDARATEGIRNAMSKANDADTHALDAGNRANQAEQTAQTAHTRITGVEQTVSKLDQYQPVTQAEIRFRPGQSALSQNAKEALDQIATSLKGQKGYIVEVEGFSPGKSNTAIETSRSMAQMVVRYLVLNHDVPLYRIYTVGMGNAPLQAEDGKMKRARGGRVEISLMKNSLADMSAGNAGAADSGAAPTGNTQPPASNQQQQQPQQQQPPLQ